MVQTCASAHPWHSCHLLTIQNKLISRESYPSNCETHKNAAAALQSVAAFMQPLLGYNNSALSAACILHDTNNSAACCSIMLHSALTCTLAVSLVACREWFFVSAVGVLLSSEANQRNYPLPFLCLQPSQQGLKNYHWLNCRWIHLVSFKSGLHGPLMGFGVIHGSMVPSLKSASAPSPPKTWLYRSAGSSTSRFEMHHAGTHDDILMCISFGCFGHCDQLFPFMTP